MQVSLPLKLLNGELVLPARDNMKFYIYNNGTVQIPEREHDLSMRFLLAGARPLRDWADYMHEVSLRKIEEKPHPDKENPKGYIHNKYFTPQPDNIRRSAESINKYIEHQRLKSLIYMRKKRAVDKSVDKKG
jgi:hypothetical protein